MAGASSTGEMMDLEKLFLIVLGGERFEYKALRLGGDVLAYPGPWYERKLGVIDERRVCLVDRQRIAIFLD